MTESNPKFVYNTIILIFLYCVSFALLYLYIYCIIDFSSGNNYNTKNTNFSVIIVCSVYYFIIFCVLMYYCFETPKRCSKKVNPASGIYEIPTITREWPQDTTWQGNSQDTTTTPGDREPRELAIV